MSKNDEKRSTKPREVSVLLVNDLKQEETLDSKVDRIIENRNEVFVHNLKQLMKKEELTQSGLCRERLDDTLSSQQLSGYMHKKKEIPFKHMIRIALAFGYEPELLLGQLLDEVEENSIDLDQASPRPQKEYEKYTGTYNMAYFSTDAKLGGNRRSTARAIANGVMSIIYRDKNGERLLDVLAFVNCTDSERKSLLAEVRMAERKGNPQGIRKCYENIAGVKKPGTNDCPRMKCLYEGRVDLTERVAEMTLKQKAGNDVIHLFVHNRAANSSEGSTYQGGLATMMSVSRGEEHMPCIQLCVLSKRDFTIAKEELATYLLLEPPRIDLQEETKAIVAYTKAMFPGDASETPLSQLSEADKAFALEQYIEMKLMGVIKRNVLGFCKISTEQDSKVYKAVCRDQ